MQRRDFLKNSTLATAALYLGACGSDKGTDDTGGGTTTTTGTSTTTATGTTSTTSSTTSSTTTSSTTTTATCTIGDATGPDDNHGHSIAIPTADLNNPQDRTYTSTGGTHDHQVDITAAELTTLATTCTVTITSNDTHAHTWIVTIP